MNTVTREQCYRGIIIRENIIEPKAMISKKIDVFIYIIAWLQ
jgi:hypothetical protein